jgi:hypothetical protein
MRTRPCKARGSLQPRHLALAFMLSLAVPAEAQLAAPPVHVQATPIPNGLTEFAQANPQCTEMTNGCEICVRGSLIECSTPGIACQPVAWQCKKGTGSANDSAKSPAPSK